MTSIALHISQRIRLARYVPKQARTYARRVKKSRLDPRHGCGALPPVATFGVSADITVVFKESGAIGFYLVPLVRHCLLDLGGFEFRPLGRYRTLVEA